MGSIISQFPNEIINIITEYTKDPPKKNILELPGKIGLSIKRFRVFICVDVNIPYMIFFKGSGRGPVQICLDQKEKFMIDYNATFNDEIFTFKYHDDSYDNGYGDPVKREHEISRNHLNKILQDLDLQITAMGIMVLCKHNKKVLGLSENDVIEHSLCTSEIYEKCKSIKNEEHNIKSIDLVCHKPSKSYVLIRFY
ncbi:MAG: hypothetical protein Solumvirus5_4 [Solumvirus sp.]|uniref:Uncharacterized protein n=1 Tax=Solumvirus sp. TaxID=2487773 RepID=A0A3G5AGL9_9VIRU|nr:MAG: hypothetical protein Solumvirus5_4 [Solumvirus sp.]